MCINISGECEGGEGRDQFFASIADPSKEKKNVGVEMSRRIEGGNIGAS